MRAAWLAALLACGCGGGDPCGDGISDGDESDVDCGGASCGKCMPGQLCFVNADCAGGFCANGRCPLPSCVDGKKNGKETDVDCGGGACPGCNGGQACNIAVDCASFTCVNNVCSGDAQCLDQMQDGDESDVDCGGGVCPGCADGMLCAMPQDCATGACTSGVCGAGDPCSDGKRDGNESDVDCGGSCAGCPDGKKCQGGPDCDSGFCLAGVCGAPHALTLALGLPVIYPIGLPSGPSFIAVGDVDGDHQLDAIAGLPGQQGTSQVVVLLGDGNGALAAPRSSDVAGVLSGLAVGDWNGDGRSDVAVGNSGSDVAVYLGAANGSLTRQASLVATAPTVVLAGEVTGDQRIDLVVVEQPGDLSQRATAHVWVGKGTGVFQKGASLAVGFQPDGGGIGDFNRDGKRDILIANFADQNNSNGSFSVLLGNGGGSFKPSVETAAANPRVPQVGDWNGDGKSDLFYASSMSQLYTSLGVGDGNFKAATAIVDPNFPIVETVGDLDLDGNLDLVILDDNGQSRAVSVLRGKGDGTFQPAIGFPSVQGALSAAVGDVNGDGRPDLVLGTTPSQVTIILNTSM